MDIVITYVDGLDPLWQDDYARYNEKPVLEKRFRDWGTLKYLLRGIENNMPFIGNVFLVVARESQVPAWVDRNNLHIVLHSEIIPSGFLPIFNASAIELFLHNIKGLDEEYLYFNDDMYPVRKCRKEDFFRNGRPVIKYSKCLFHSNMYMKLTRNADIMARKALGMRKGLHFVRPQHICSPMLKSVCRKVYTRMEKEIIPTISRIRTSETPNQYLFLDYMYYNGTAINEKLSNTHFSLAVSTADKICRFLDEPQTDLVCINDVQMSEQKYKMLRERILQAFDRLLPAKSRFEI